MSESGAAPVGTREVAGPAGICELEAAVSRRWRRIDPLLPEPSSPTETCGVELTVTAAGGHAIAAGSCMHVILEPGQLELAWGAARQFVLTPQVDGPDVGAALDELLGKWRQHVAAFPDANDPDSAAVIRWPSRDIDGVRAILAHGLKPLTVTAVRPAGRDTGAGMGRRDAGGVRIRTAEPRDLDAVERLAFEVIRYDAHFGAVTVRPETRRSVRESAAKALAAANPWLWLAERDGNTLGMIHAEPPEQASWIAPLVRPQPAAYISDMSVLPGERGTGVGTALIACLHHELDQAGVAVTLLHHAQLNPLSAPFWSRMGYRPLWTSWEVRSADKLS